MRRTKRAVHIVLPTDLNTDWSKRFFRDHDDVCDARVIIDATKTRQADPAAIRTILEVMKADEADSVEWRNVYASDLPEQIDTVGKDFPIHYGHLPASSRYRLRLETSGSDLSHMTAAERLAYSAPDITINERQMAFILDYLTEQARSKGGRA